jgi:PHP family Zn ribbon phosphoesterase
MHSKKAWQHYNALISSFGNEFNILLHVSIQQLAKHDEKLASLISLNREGKIKVKPGYDGEYGKVILQEKQETLFNTT